MSRLPLHTGPLVLLALTVTASGCLYEPLSYPRSRYPRRPPPVSRPPERRPPAPLPPSAEPDLPEMGPSPERGDRAAVLLANEISYHERYEDEGGVESRELTALRMTAEAADRIAEGNDREALELLERAVAIDDSSGFAYLYLARVHFHRGSYSLSEQFLARARPLLPPDRRLQRSLRRLENDIRERRAAGPVTVH